MAKQTAFAAVEASLRKCALAYPETHEDFPWGHSAFKVKGKVFLFMSSGKAGENVLNLSMKLPESGRWALTLPFASPTEYGLGKSGWVSAHFEAKDEVPVDILEQWIDESFRAVAPKRVLAKLEEGRVDGEKEFTAEAQRTQSKKQRKGKKHGRRIE
jgi:predicted DNA-binding protein (MmcQ/YjbR family)